MPGWLVSLPVEGLVEEYAFGHRPGVVQRRRSQVFERRRIVSAGQHKIPRGQPRDRRRARVEQKLVNIKTVSFAGFVRALHAVREELTGADPLHPHVPDISGAVVRGIQIDHPSGHGVVGMAEQLQSDSGGMTAEQGEVHAAFCFEGSQRQRSARSHVSAIGESPQCSRATGARASPSALPEDASGFQGNRHSRALRDHARRVVARWTRRGYRRAIDGGAGWVRLRPRARHVLPYRIAAVRPVRIQFDAHRMRVDTVQKESTSNTVWSALR